jgi:hypothetical protein
MPKFSLTKVQKSPIILPGETRFLTLGKGEVRMSYRNHRRNVKATILFFVIFLCSLVGLCLMKAEHHKQTATQLGGYVEEGR